MFEGSGGKTQKAKCVGMAVGIAVSVGLAATAWASTGGEHGLPWKDFLFRLLNFSILLAVMVKLLKQPLTKFLVSRRDGIEKNLKDLEEKKLEAENKCAEYKAKLATLEKETENIIAEYIQEGELEKQKIIATARAQAEYFKQQAQFAIQQEIKAAKASLQEEIAELSVSAAEDILKKNIRAEDQKRLVGEFMSKVVEAK